MAAFLPVYNASPEGAPGGVCLLEERMSVRDPVLDAGLCESQGEIWIGSLAEDMGPTLG